LAGKTLVLFSLVLIGAGCKGKEQNVSQNVNGVDTIAVTIVPAAKADFIISKSFAASLEGEEQANVTAKLAERITAIKCKVGESVKAGQVLVTLDKSGSTSQYFQTEAALKNAAKDLDRMQALLKDGAISQQVFDGVQTQYTIAKANFEAAKSMIELTAPISGIITAVNGRIGDNANPMLPILTIAKIGSLKAIFNAGEADVAKLAIGKMVQITSDAKPSLLLRGSVMQIAKSADDQSRSFEVKALFANTPDAWLKPGMFCKVTVELENKKDAIKIPVSALITRGADTYAFVALNGKAVEHKVRTGLTDGTFTEITEGLSAGDAVITVGVNEVQNNSPLRVQNK
jgi:membrane fusion protein (multidrug efflux system)